MLAHAQDTPGATDLIELRNDGETPIDLSGMGLTDDPTLPYRFAFPPGTRIAPGAYLVLAAGPAAGGHAFATGFALDAGGDRLFLVRTPESGAAVVDSVRFGPQVPGISVGRRRDGSWGPCVPTFGGPNVALLTGDPRRVRINEWLADARFAGTGDFVELYNPETLVVDLSGCRLSDAAGSLDRFVVPPLTFVGPRSHLVFRASDDGTPDDDRLPFRLSSDSGILALSSPEGERIDVVDYASARTDVSQGRSPDGSSTFSAFPMPTPGSNNPGNAVGECTESTLIVPLVPMGSRWRYQQSANLDGTGWQLPDYDDSSWPEGPALLAVETSALPSPGKNTELSIGRTTYYFRTRFLVSTNLEGFRLHGSMVVDDGARVFLNGRAIWTNGLPSGVIAYATPANRNVGNADIESIPLPSDALLPGTNVLAAEVHQVNASSTDIVWGLAVEARRTVVECTPGTLPTIALDEVLVLSRPDPAAEPRTEGFVEVVNFGSAPVSLEGMSLSDDPGRPAAWLFPAATSVAPGQRIVVDFGASPRATTAPPGFSLRPRGGALYLYDARDRGGSLLDAVRYGIQIPDHSIARVPSGIGPWALARPTPGSTNTPAVLADPSHLKVNEWLADPIEGGDWFELHNTSDLPVGLAGTFLTDDFADPTRAPVAPLSFIGSGRDAFVRFFADGDTAAGPDHVGFSLRRAGESLAVYAPEGWLVDGIVFGPQTTGVSQGRLPDGGAEIAAFRVPSPASSNRLPSNDSDSDGLDDAWERSYFGGLDRDGTGDADADGARDADEFSAGTNPVDADDVLRFAEISVARPTSLRFRAKAGRSYAVQVRDTLSSDTAWALLQSVPARDAAEWVTVIDAGFAPSARFYRLVTPAP
ncbi:MAG: lamin tail domain-containing protein [Verrucomicrobiales bacterium]|nr:lamin tail domain-containing protein [Verrucomicrobiales bacterium]